MSRTRSCFSILFGLSIVAGISIGAMIKDILYPQTVDITATVAPSTIVPELPEEDTLLFIGVDQLQSQNPLLEGVWLASVCEDDEHSKETVHITLITLYPFTPNTLDSPEQTIYTKPHQGIPINPDNFSSLSNVLPIRDIKETWSNIIFLDEYAMNLIISLTNLSTPRPIPTPPPNAFIKTWKNPTAAFEQQKAILHTLCEEPDAFSRYETIQEIVDLTGSHIKTDLSVDDLIKTWQLVNLSLGKEVHCEFYP